MLHELDGDHRTDTADVPDDGIFQRECSHGRLQERFDPTCLGEQVLALDLIEHRDSCCRRNRIARKGAAETSGVRRIHDLGTTGHGSDRESTGNAFRGDDHVWLEPKMLTRIVLSGAGHPALHFVCDKHDPVGCAPLLQSNQVAFGGHDESTLTLHGLSHDTRQVGGADGFLQIGDRARGGIRAAESIAERIGARSVEDRRCERPETGLVRHRLERHRHREVRTTVVRMVEHGNAGAARV